MRYEQSQEAAKFHTLRARNCAIILRARYGYEKTKDVDAYKKEIASFTDPSDFGPYTEAELDAFTIKMESLSADFYDFTAAFIALNYNENSDDEFHITAHACFNVYCETYKMAADAYKTAALLAAVTAAETIAQAVKDGAKAWLKEIAINPNAPAKKTEGEIKAEEFQEKAKLADAKAEAFLARIREVVGE